MNSELQAQLASLFQQYGQNAVQIALYLMQNSSVENLFETGEIPANQIGDAVAMQRLWQYALYPGSVALMVGETGVGKSSLLYNFAIRAALDMPLWGVPFEQERPLRVLYVDRENSGLKRQQKISRIGLGKPESLFFHDGHGVNLADGDMMMQLQQYIVKRAIDIVILDPIVALFATINENDNAEAQRQMNALISLAQQTNVSVVAVHHTDKANQGIGGRGATARIAAADVAYLIGKRASRDDGDFDDTFKGETLPREDILRFRITKNRMEGLGSLYLQMIGNDQFALSSFAAWKAGKEDESTSHVDSCAQEIIAALSSGQWMSRAEVYALAAQEGFGHGAADAALDHLQLVGTIATQKLYGVPRYILASYLDTENHTPGDDGGQWV